MEKTKRFAIDFNGTYINDITRVFISFTLSARRLLQNKGKLSFSSIKATFLTFSSNSLGFSSRCDQVSLFHFLARIQGKSFLPYKIVLTLKSRFAAQLNSLELCLSHQEVGHVRGGDRGVQERLVGQHLLHVAESLILHLNM